MPDFFQPIYGYIISAALGYCLAFIKRTYKNQKAERQALGALLRHNMFVIYREYIDAEAVPKDIHEEMEHLHEAYHTLKFNHMGDVMYQAIIAKKIV